MTRQHAFLRLFSLFTALLWGLVVLEFLARGRYGVPELLPELYLLILGFYVGDKEVRRWRRRYQPRHRPGELFVAVWLITTLIMLGIEIIGGAEHGYRVPHQLPFITSGVLVLYVITEYLKQEFRRPRQPHRSHSNRS